MKIVLTTVMAIFLAGFSVTAFAGADSSGSSTVPDNVRSASKERVPVIEVHSGTTVNVPAKVLATDAFADGHPLQPVES